MSRFSLFILFVFSLSLSSVSMAEWVKVTGQASVKTQPYEQARETAREDALRQALFHNGAKVESHQYVENGIIKKDKLSVSTEARIRKSVLEHEYESNGILHLVMNVDVEELASCPGSQAKDYRKKIAVLGFSMQAPEQLRMGKLDSIERGLSSALNKSLQGQGSLIVHEQSGFSLYSDTINAPSQLTGQNTITKATDYAKQTGAQFVVSGVIRDMSVEDSDAFSTSVLGRIKRFIGVANTDRRFAMELFVHDGYSGDIVWQRGFSVSAPWNKSISDNSGFGGAEFWADDYGHAVGSLVDNVAALIAGQLECQPFITRISRVDGKTLHFESGASSGIKPGDKFSLYRTYNYYDSNLLAGTELTSAKTSLTVSQVHPGFASGAVSVDPGRINVQEDDLLIAW